MASRALTSLRHCAETRAHAWIAGCAARGVDVLVYCTYRGPVEQAALYAQGREPLERVNALRTLAGLYPVGEAEARRIVTWAKPGESWHNWCLAWDAVALVAGRPQWHQDAPEWRIMAEEARARGIEPGADFPAGRREYPHFQYRGGLTIAQVAAGGTPAA